MKDKEITIPLDLEEFVSLLSFLYLTYSDPSVTLRVREQAGLLYNKFKDKQGNVTNQDEGGNDD